MKDNEFRTKMDKAHQLLGQVEDWRSRRGTFIPSATIRNAIDAIAGLAVAVANGTQEQKTSAADLYLTLEVATLGLIEQCYERALAHKEPTSARR